MKTQLAINHGMNWNWYLAFTVSDDDATIQRLAEDRFHKYDYSQGAELDDLLEPLARGIHYTINEPHISERPDNAPREAYGITINGLYRPLYLVEPRFVYHPFDWRALASSLGDKS